jgi:hypothetical protein
MMYVVHIHYLLNEPKKWNFAYNSDRRMYLLLRFLFIDLMDISLISKSLRPIKLWSKWSFSSFSTSKAALGCSYKTHRIKDAKLTSVCHVVSYETLWRDHIRINCATQLRATLTWLRRDWFDLNIQIRVEIIR